MNVGLEKRCQNGESTLEKIRKKISRTRVKVQRNLRSQKDKISRNHLEFKNPFKKDNCLKGRLEKVLPKGVLNQIDYTDNISVSFIQKIVLSGQRDSEIPCELHYESVQRARQCLDEEIKGLKPKIVSSFHEGFTKFNTEETIPIPSSMVLSQKRIEELCDLGLVPPQLRQQRQWSICGSMMDEELEQSA